MSSSHARTPPPRPLGNSETLETLTHWRTTFKTFYKRDESYRFFVKETTKWDPSNDNYNQIAEGENGLKRTAADMKEDLIDLLNTLAGYLPHSYLTDKIVSGTKGWQDVWNVIYDHYGVQISSESLLDFESMHKQPGETHRQFYERLLQHVKQHLAPADVKVEQVRNTVADTMSISLMNMTALQWMRKTSGSLIDIVRTEYSTELRDNVQLAELVPHLKQTRWTMLILTKPGGQEQVQGPLSKETMVDVLNPCVVARAEEQAVGQAVVQVVVEVVRTGGVDHSVQAVTI